MLIRSCNCLNIIDIQESDYASSNKPATNLCKNTLFDLERRYKYTKFRIIVFMRFSAFSRPALIKYLPSALTAAERKI